MKELNVGDKVLHALHGKGHDGWQGYVTQIDRIENTAGAMTWYWVKWVDPHGKVADSDTRFARSELTAV